MVRNMVLLHGATWLNGALWSLQWEVVFSLLLPIFVFVALATRRAPWVALVLLLLLIAAGVKSDYASVQFIPIFGVGVLMAINRDRLSRLAPTRGRVWWLLTVATVLLLTCRWWAEPHPTSGGKDQLISFEVLGAALAVYLFANWPAARRLGEVKPAQWLGRRSFSLYLVHEPIVVSLALLLGGHANPMLILAVAVPLSLLASDLFFRAVEGPSHRFSQLVGRRVRSGLVITEAKA